MRKLFCLLLLLCLLCGCSAPAAPSAPTEPLGELKVHYIDVGAGDCTLVACNGKYMLIDAGESTAGNKIVSYLKALGVEKLDVVVSTHPHTDHMNGFKIVLPEFELETVYTCYLTSREPFYINFMDTLRDQAIIPETASAGDRFSLGGASVTVVGPVATYGSANNDSLVLMIEFGSTRFLFAADMESTAEADLIASGKDLTADVLRVGHHGRDTSTTGAFLDAVKPGHAVISAGSSAPPDSATLQRLEQQNIAIFRTDTMGTIVATSDGTNITFTKEQK